MLIISVAIAGFFAYQTQKLVKELTNLKNEEKVAVATTEPTIEPISTNSAVATADPTANWKTYENSKYKYSLSLPKNWIVGNEVFGGAVSKINPSLKVSTIKFNNNLSTIQVFYEGDFDHGFEPWQFEEKKIINFSGKLAEETTLKLDGNQTKWYVITTSSINGFRIEANIHPDDSAIFDQILSTFKFTN